MKILSGPLRERATHCDVKPNFGLFEARVLGGLTRTPSLV
jgi:hypothetical protein